MSLTKTSSTPSSTRWWSEDLGEEPDRWLVIGPDTAGNLLEVVWSKRRRRAHHPCHADAAEVPEALRTLSTEPHGHTRSGAPLTDEVLGHLAEEADQGYDVEELVGRRGKRGRPPLGKGPSTVESVRLDPELKEQLVRRAEADGVAVSDVIREALRHHLDAAS